MRQTIDRGSRVPFVVTVFAVVCAALIALPNASAQGAREQADKRDVKKQEFLKRLPLETRCKAEVAGGVVKPEGENKWKSGPFEVEAEDDFRATIAMIDQLPRDEQEVCEVQARGLEYDDVQRARYLDDGWIVCMKRVYNDRGRLPQLLACRVSALLTQPTHLRCKNLDPILDPDGIFVAPNHLTVMTLPQAVMTKGTCQAADRF
jgi:hypothetical protein